MATSNPFEVLGHHEGETSETRSPLLKNPSSKDEMLDLSLVKNQDQNNNICDEGMRQESEEEVEDMDIGELDLEGIEKEYTEKDKVYVPQEQVSILKEDILKSRTSNSLGISSGSHKDMKKKAEDFGQKTDHKTKK